MVKGMPCELRLDGGEFSKDGENDKFKCSSRRAQGGEVDSTLDLSLHEAKR